MAAKAAAAAAAAKGVADLGIQAGVGAAAGMRCTARGVFIGRDPGPRAIGSRGVMSAPRHFSCGAKLEEGDSTKSFGANENPLKPVENPKKPALQQSDLDKTSHKLEKTILISENKFTKDFEAFKFEMKTELNKYYHQMNTDLATMKHEFSEQVSALQAKYDKHELKTEVAMKSATADRLKMFGWFVGVVSAIGATFDIFKRGKGPNP